MILYIHILNTISPQGASRRGGSGCKEWGHGRLVVAIRASIGGGRGYLYVKVRYSCLLWSTLTHTYLNNHNNQDQHHECHDNSSHLPVLTLLLTSQDAGLVIKLGCLHLDG